MLISITMPQRHTNSTPTLPGSTLQTIEFNCDQANEPF